LPTVSHDGAATQRTPTPTRDDEQDHDLLTYGEVRVRLHEEIAREHDRLPQLGNAEAALVEKRIAALRAAVERNGRRRINDEHFERFFGYPARFRSAD
jgi:hypothetical protein